MPGSSCIVGRGTVVQEPLNHGHPEGTRPRCEMKGSSRDYGVRRLLDLGDEVAEQLLGRFAAEAVRIVVHAHA